MGCKQMNPKLLQALGLTNLSDQQLSAITDAIGIEKATILAELTPTERHFYSIEEQNRLRVQILELKSENATLQQIRKAGRLIGFISTCSITIGAGMISTFGARPDALWLGVGWGLTIVGVGILAINSIFGY